MFKKRFYYPALFIFIVSLSVPTNILLSKDNLFAEIADENNKSGINKIHDESKESRREIQDIKKEISQPIAQIKEDKPAGKSATNVSPKLVKISVKENNVLGDSKAPVTIVAYSDYQCSFCKRFFDNTLPGLKTEFIDKGKVRFIMREFPIPSHTRAKELASAATCAGQQGKYWQMHDLLFVSPPAQNNKEQWNDYNKKIGLDSALFEKCMNDPKTIKDIQSDKEEGERLGVTGTPSFVIGKTVLNEEMDGELIIGAKKISIFRDKINALLSK